VLPLPVARWFAEPSALEQVVLSRAKAPVLDVGCGPARHTLTLRSRGMTALGIDVASTAVRVARERGAPVLQRCVFSPLPGEGAWGSALLFDGNIGIGGRPVALLARLRRALRRDGRILVEVGPPGAPTESFRARIDRGAWFPWATVGVDALGGVAEAAGFRLRELWSADGRWFGSLDK
jgi:SAM-dependent methyltransferase